MSRSAVLAVLVGIVAALIAAPAAAGPPAEFTFRHVLVQPNPCEPSNLHEVTFEDHVTIHEHNNNVVVVITQETSTDSGFVGTAHQTIVETKKVFSAVLNAILRNGETHALIQAKGRILVDLTNNEVVLDAFTLRCVGS